MAKRLFDIGVDTVRGLLGTERASSGSIRALVERGTYGAFNRLVGFAIPFTRRNGFRVLEVGPGYVKAGIRLRHNENHVGAMYAGAMFLLAEIPGGVMTIFEFGGDYVPNLKELTMRYLKPAKTDLTVEFRLPPEQLREILRLADESGKADFTLEGELKDKSGEVVARSTGLYQVRRRAKR